MAFLTHKTYICELILGNWCLWLCVAAIHSFSISVWCAILQNITTYLAILLLKDICIAFSSLNKSPMTLAGAAAAAKSLQSCPTLCAHQAPPSLGFSRQEHWSGVPFPSPMHESEKWKWSRSVVSDSSRPHGLQPTRLLSPWDFPGKSTGVGCQCLLH